MKQFITHRSKIVIGLAALVFTVGFGAGVASAQNAHFVRADVSVDSAGDGECTFKVSGYGNLPTGSSVEVTCAADANACYACRNNGGNFPSDPKKQAETGTVSATGEFPVGRNGTITGSLDFGPPASTLNCPGGQHTVLVSVLYSNVSLSSDSTPSDSDADATANVPGTFDRKLITTARAQC